MGEAIFFLFFILLLLNGEGAAGRPSILQGRSRAPCAEEGTRTTCTSFLILADGRSTSLEAHENKYDLCFVCQGIISNEDDVWIPYTINNEVIL